jgi:hypothetical protein
MGTATGTSFCGSPELAAAAALLGGAASLFIEQELSPKRVQALILSLRADKGLYRSVVQIWG